MNLNLRRIAAAMLIATTFTFAGIENVAGQITRVLSVDNSATTFTFTDPDTGEPGEPVPFPGAFPNSLFDVFGITQRGSVNFDFQDDSLSIFPGDVFGIIPEGKTDSFLAFADLTNPDNPDGIVTVVWTFDVSSQSDLGFSFDIAAMGDFEGPERTGGNGIADVLTLTASVDGGTPTIVRATGEDDAPFSYTLEGGTVITDVEDPLRIGQDLDVDDAAAISAATAVDNIFQTLNFDVAGTGSTLTLTLEFVADGTSEPVAIDNVAVTSGGVAFLTDDFDTPGGDLNGDFDGDGDVDCDDTNLFAGNLGSSSATFDLDTSGSVDLVDVALHVETLVVTENGVTGTFLGDVNCDGSVSVTEDAFVLVANLLTDDPVVYTDADINLDGSVDVVNDAFVIVANLGLSNSTE